MAELNSSQSPAYLSRIHIYKSPREFENGIRKTEFERREVPFAGRSRRISRRRRSSGNCSRTSPIRRFRPPHATPPPRASTEIRINVGDPGRRGLARRRYEGNRLSLSLSRKARERRELRRYASPSEVCRSSWTRASCRASSRARAAPPSSRSTIHKSPNFIGSRVGGSRASRCASGTQHTRALGETRESAQLGFECETDSPYSFLRKDDAPALQFEARPAAPNG